MSAAEVVLAVGLAVAALYGMGLPLAWLLPAPPASPWLHRIALAPLLAILAGGLGAQLLGLLGVPLRGYQLAIVAVVLWTLAWRRARPWQRLRQGLGSAWAPLALVGMGAVTWAGTLVGYGMMLPNRDFKNHTMLVAQIASAGVADQALMLRASPVSEGATGGYYPPGLHNLLAWSLPSPSYETVGITAAAAVVCLLVSLPLGMVVLGRMWAPDEWESLPWLSAVLVVLLPAATQTFMAIGSVTNLVAFALLPPALACLWQAGRTPSAGSILAAAAAGCGLFQLHLAEAMGLALVALTLPFARDCSVRSMMRPRILLPGALLVAVTLVAVFSSLGQLAGAHLASEEPQSWDIAPNTLSVPEAFLNAVGQQPTGSPTLNLAWWGLAVAGWIVARRRGMSVFVLASVLVPLALSVVAHARGLPDVLTTLTAPWYGSATRIMLAAQPGLVLAAAFGLVAAVRAGRSAMLRTAFVLACVLLVVSSSATLVIDRRAAFAENLAGAGDTPQVASWVADQLAEGGGTVLNLEGDGSAMLFPWARVPVLAGLTDAEISPPQGDGLDLTAEFLRLGTPAVEDALRAHDVRFIALGTTTRYWGTGPGYAWQAVAAQPEVELVKQGNDLTILSYRGSAP